MFRNIVKAEMNEVSAIYVTRVKGSNAFVSVLHVCRGTNFASNLHPGVTMLPNNPSLSTMKTLIFIITLAGGVHPPQAACNPLDNFFSKADLFLRTHVTNGLVDYNAIKSGPQSLNALVNMMADTELSAASQSEKKAFWINAYNITMIISVIDNMPMKSPLDVPGLFDSKKHKIAGEMMTLNDLEKKKLLEVHHDARIHFVLVCGAKGCPTLLSGAYLPGRLESQIMTQTKLALNDPRFIRADSRSRRVSLSEIFKWYEADFTTGGMTVLQYVNQFRTAPIPSDYKVDYYEYDWSLNIKG